MIKKIDIGELTPEMNVYGLEREDADGVSFFADDLLIKSPKEIARLHSKGYRFAYIYVEGAGVRGTAHRLAHPSRTGQGGSGAEQLFHGQDKPVEGLPDKVVELPFSARDASGGNAETQVCFEDEINEAGKIRGEAIGLVHSFMQDVRAGKAIDQGSVKDMAEEMVASVFRNAEALLTLARLKDFDNYTFVHSVNVSTLATVLGRYMGYSRGELHELATGAILHDIGKMLISDEILNKPGKLTESEFEVVRSHTFYGHDILYGTEGIADSSLHAVLQHHERYDGSGYPEGLKGKDIHPFGRILGVADVYDAMTSDRVYQKAGTPNNIIKNMYSWRGSQFDPGFMEKFLLCMGIYPRGSLVEFDTKEVGVVLSVNRANFLKPRVVVVVNKNRKPLTTPFEVDLIEDGSRTIRAALDPKTIDFHIHAEDFLA